MADTATDISTLRVKGDEDDKAEYEKHPSFGMVGFSRRHGQQRLHGSDIIHQDTVSLQISHGAVKRQYHREWYYAKDTVIEVILSAEQFAQLLTSMNVGDGVPCTISFEQGKGHIEFPKPEKTTREKFEDELSVKCRRISRRLDALGEMIDNAKLTTKERTALKDELRMAAQDISSNIPFLQESFHEVMDHTVTEAKAEVEAFYMGAVQRTGLTMAQVHAAEEAAMGRLRVVEGKIVDANVIEGEVIEQPLLIAG